MSTHRHTHMHMPASVVYPYQYGLSSSSLELTQYRQTDRQNSHAIHRHARQHTMPNRPPTPKQRSNPTQPPCRKHLTQTQQWLEPTNRQPDLSVEHHQALSTLLTSVTLSHRFSSSRRAATIPRRHQLKVPPKVHAKRGVAVRHRFLTEPESRPNVIDPLIVGVRRVGIVVKHPLGRRPTLRAGGGGRVCVAGRVAWREGGGGGEGQ
mmetsp:Transcript_6240/g.17928  ORF Transcript_6240/g.17928 Transcript_6240/m.17928 type:complete len:207 (-) Transcript_6240:338-958(-)